MFDYTQQMYTFNAKYIKQILLSNDKLKKYNLKVVYAQRKTFEHPKFLNNAIM